MEYEVVEMNSSITPYSILLQLMPNSRSDFS